MITNSLLLWQSLFSKLWHLVRHSDTYIHGPFNFATAHGRQTRNRISTTDWDKISSHSSMFSNPLPSSDLPSYSIHVDHGVLISYCNISSIQLLLSASADDNANPVYLWQKVSVFRSRTPNFFSLQPNQILVSRPILNIVNSTTYQTKKTTTTTETDTNNNTVMVTDFVT